jgi:hypothetical protein
LELARVSEVSKLGVAHGVVHWLLSRTLVSDSLLLLLLLLLLLWPAQAA